MIVKKNPTSILTSIPTSNKIQSLKNLTEIVTPPLFVFIFILGCSEFLVRADLIKDYILPAPSQVWSAFGSSGSELQLGFLNTALCAFLGLALSFITGTLLAILLFLSRLLRRALMPYAIFFQTVPVIAIAPMLVIWFGFGRPTVIASAFVVSVFPIISSTLIGLQSTDPALVDLFRLYSASRWDHIFRLRLPFALPHVFSGLRIAAGLAVIGAIVGEFIGGGGLGSVIDAARTQQRVDLVFAAVMLASIIGLCFVGGVWLLMSFTSREK